MIYPASKRLVDVVASAAGLIALSPILVCVAAAVRLSSPGPVLFRHERIGLGGRKFKLLKFRTMSHGSVGAQITVGGDRRVTRVGRLLRRTKIDELPQLWNVLVGDMSLVGPRPEVERYVNEFAQEYHEILKVKPGITDFAAIEYRDEESVLATAMDPEAEYRRVVLPAKIGLYRKYIAEQSLWTDFTILARTAAAIVRRE
jgi:lipopolysaccharide/colanic/teichoic acid biosynthesis glycosyltransferase